MSNVKTAISLPEPLFKQLDLLARQLAVSRSRLFTMALEEFLLEYENRSLLERLNRVYGDGTDSDEQENLLRMKSRHRQLVEKEW